jgi:hypothetical protein
MKTTIIAHPNAKKPRIETDLLGTLHVYVTAPPLDGKANKAVLEALANYYGVSKGKVTFVSGAKSKLKVFEIIQ